MIGKSIYSLLSGHAPLVALVGTNIFPVQATQTKENPIVVYGISNTEPQESKQRTSPEDWIDVELVIYSDDYDQSHEIAKEIRAALDKQSGTIAGNEISDIIMTGFEDGWEEKRKCFAPMMKFQIMSKP